MTTNVGLHVTANVELNMTTNLGSNTTTPTATKTTTRGRGDFMKSQPMSVSISSDYDLNMDCNMI